MTTFPLADPDGDQLRRESDHAEALAATILEDPAGTSPPARVSTTNLPAHGASSPIEGAFGPTLAGLHDLARQAVAAAPTDKLRESARVLTARVGVLISEARSDGWSVPHE